jgi:hypothetical protein
MSLTDRWQPMDRSASLRKARPRGRDTVRQTLTVIMVGAALGVSLFAIGEYITQRQHDIAPAVAVAAIAGEDAYTGSVLYMPEQGRTCHQVLFNNQTGRFSDNGEVDCVAAAYRSPNEPKQWSSARTRVISSGFRDR